MPQLFLAFHLGPKLFFRMSSIVHMPIYAYSMLSLGDLFSIIYVCFFIRALVGVDIIGLLCFLVSFAMLVAFCWIISVMVTCKVPTSHNNRLSNIWQKINVANNYVIIK